MAVTKPPPALWDIKELADFLGVSVRTIELWRQNGFGPEALRIGRGLRWEPEVAQAWARDQRESQQSASA